MTPIVVAAVRRRMAVAFAIVAGLSLVLPAVLWAHARLTKSEPAAGAQVATSPVAIRLWFSERTEVSLSRIRVEDSLGQAIPMGAVARDSERLAIRAEILRPLEPGRYTISWRTAGVDGHPLEGSFRFVVLPRSDSTAAPAVFESTAAAGDTAVTMQHTMDATSPTFVFARALLFASMLAVIGAIVFLAVILPRVGRLTDTALDDMRARTGRLGAWAAWLLILAVVARLVLQSIVVNGPRAFEHLPLVHLTLHTQWGKAWVAQFGAALLAYAALRGLARGQRAGLLLGVLATVVLAVTPALSGHAAALERLSSLAIAADAAHVLGAAGWLGSLLCMTAAAIPELVRSTDDRRWQSAATLVNAFSPFALIFAGIVVLTGAMNALLELGALSALWTTGYGRVLLMKLALFVLVIAAGAHNWRRVRPALGSQASTGRLVRWARIELAFALTVVVATAILVAMPTPVSD